MTISDSTLFCIALAVIFIIVISGMCGMNSVEKMKLKFREKMTTRDYNTVRRVLENTTNYVSFHRAYPQVSARDYEKLRRLNIRGELRNIDIKLALSK